MQKLKSFLGTWLRNPWVLFLLSVSFLTGKMAFDHIYKLRANLPAELTSAQVWGLLSANIHWMLAISVFASFIYALGLSLAFRPASDERSLRRHVSLWLLLSLGGGALQFLHGNYLLPRGNLEARGIKRELDPFADPAKKEKKIKKGAREMGIGELRAALAKARKDIELLRIRIGNEGEENRKKLEEGIERREKWMITLRWEMVKKFQLALYWPLLTAIALNCTLFLKRIPFGLLRFLAVYLSCRILLAAGFGSLVWTAKRLNGGAPAYTAWLFFFVVFLLSLVSTFSLWRRFRSDPSDAVPALPA